MHKNVSFAKQSIFVMCDILEVYHYVSATHFTDTYTWEPRFCDSNPGDGHQLVVVVVVDQFVVAEAKKLSLVPSSRCVLTVGEEERAANINGISSKQKTNLKTKTMLVNPDVHQLVVPSSIVRLLCVGEEARAGNINGAQLLGRELLLGWSFGLKAFLFKGERDSASHSHFVWSVL